jgi:hypothetical protein
MHHRSTVRLLAAVLALTLTAAACGDDTDTAAGSEADPTTASTEEHGDEERDDAPGDGHESEDADATEVEEPNVRLLVADGAEPIVRVVDLTSGEEIAALEVTGPAALAPVGRSALAAQRDDGVVDVIDGGAWSEPHGEHFHHYVVDPSIAPLGTPVDQPTHVVEHDGLIAIFDDGDGSVTIVEAEHLGHDDAVVAEIETGGAHHGVAVALEEVGVLLATTPVEGESLPDGVTSFDLASGELIERLGDCPGLHGELATHTAVVFGCADGVLVLEPHDGHWDVHTIANPEGTPDGDRTGSFVGDHDLDYVIGTLSDDTIVHVDLVDHTSTVLPLPGTRAAMAFDAEHEVVVVLTTDGQVHRIDPTTGDVLGSVAVLEAFELPEGHGGPPTPSVIVAGDRAYVTDPGNGRIVELGISDELRIARELSVGGAPSSLAVVGLAASADH